MSEFTMSYLELSEDKNGPTTSFIYICHCLLYYLYRFWYLQMFIDVLCWQIYRYGFNHVNSDIPFLMAKTRKQVLVSCSSDWSKSRSDCHGRLELEKIEKLVKNVKLFTFLDQMQHIIHCYNGGKDEQYTKNGKTHTFADEHLQQLCYKWIQWQIL